MNFHQPPTPTTLPHRSDRREAQRIAEIAAFSSSDEDWDVVGSLRSSWQALLERVDWMMFEKHNNRHRKVLNSND